MGRKSKAEERMPEILENAYKVAEDSGLQNTTLSAIARRMGVATSLLSHYFKSKDDLIVSLIHYMVEKYDRELLLDFHLIPDPRERLEAILDSRLMEYSRLAIEDKVWYEVFGMAFRNDTIKKSLESLYLKDLEYLTNEIMNLNGKKKPEKELCENLSRMILIMMEGANYYFGATGDTEGTRSAVKALKNMYLDYFIQISGLESDNLSE